MGILSFSFFFLSMLEVIAGQAATDPNEVAALNKMVDYWNLRTKLNFTVDPCTRNATWAQENANPRIACDCSASVCHVTHLSVYHPHHHGHTTSAIHSANFTLFGNRRFQGTALEGPIPSSFSALTKVEDLLLRNCRVAGQLPTHLSSFTNLQILDLSFNKLTGHIPNSFQDFASLEYLYLGSNNLSGELPAKIVTSKLVALDISFNSISGNLPIDSSKVGFSMNTVGTSINANGLLDV
ncbi:hypothetical protein RJ639_028803 [Escallonia herrerae]|uniref:Leucine-rich repeat-containing N-terminal plant-type domain-containing protein n=1 Tax=Escallonia herrerae TaxID=1293975 RepID=A0AA88X7F7_9ASTE|nr:hypothetical protein RJ639_028803 [Escallonia herrerae]